MPERTDPSGETFRSWEANAGLWTRAVRDGRIASRTVTDAAIASTIAAHRARRVLDLGCGEGWLVRRLVAETGCTAVGIDGSAALVAAARDADPAGDYRRLGFAEFVAAPEAAGGPYDAAVFNFTLFDGLAPDLLAAAASLLAAGGVVVVQTLHPCSTADGSYRDGWRTEDFAGIAAPGEAWAPMPWYFRTLEGWTAVIRAAGLALEGLREPAASGGGPPLSLLLVAGRTA